MENSRGFTLIELMIVIAIIAILATMGIVQYLDYTVRAKVSESLSLAGTAKIAVVEGLAATGQFPDNNFDAALPAANTISGQYVQSVTVGNNGQITVLFAVTGLGGNPGMNGQFLTLTPVDNQGSVDWQCAIGADITRYKYVPARCRN